MRILFDLINLPVRLVLAIGIVLILLTRGSVPERLIEYIIPPLPSRVIPIHRSE